LERRPVVAAITVDTSWQDRVWGTRKRPQIPLQRLAPTSCAAPAIALITWSLPLGHVFAAYGAWRKSNPSLASRRSF
jgi:hypothetical protein